MNQSLLDLAQKILGWPTREDLFCPSGAAKSVMAEGVNRKIGDAVRRLHKAAGARVGILTVNPSGDMTESPLALICEFPRAVGPSILRETQRLAWNSSLSPLLITVEPHIIRSFTCCQPPEETDVDRYEVNKAISRGDLSLSNEAARALHWVSLISGAFYKANEKRFQRDRRADHQLLSNMKYVRKKLLSEEHGLEEGVCHDLLARVIFIQFLMDRKTSRGQAALDSVKLEELSGYTTFGQVLRDKESAYELFKSLNQHFNGDLFAGKSASDDGGSLLTEKARVDKSHLNLLAELVEGNLAMEKGQMCLWKQYAFDVIPLEFISSIYEEFVTKRSKKEGAYYTPQHLVDYLLDGILPWKFGPWDLKIMDPSCGSGVFLVKAFQRLVYRWRAAHDWQQPSPELLRRLLEQNLLGIDSNPQAVKVASFSLYLAMCDYIEPADLWQRTSFPRLRGERIICSDFFAEDTPGARTLEDAATYDLIIGNPPWGRRTVTALAEEWAERKGWAAAQKDIGPMFLPKCLALTKPDGFISMLQPAMALLFNRGGPARSFRSRLFNQFKVEEVTNLAAVRFDHFVSSNSPVCIVTLRPVPPDGDPITYICPKPDRVSYDTNMIIIEPQDIKSIFSREAAKEPHVWAAFMWGGRRDWALIQEMSNSVKFKTLGKCEAIKTRLGIMGGEDLVDHPDILGRRILTSDVDIVEHFPWIQSAALQRIKDARARRRTDLEAFEIPQLVLKRSWSADDERFRAYLVRPDESGKGILTTDAYISVHAPKDQMATLEAACLTYNSAVAVYYLLLTSGRFASERPALLVQEALNMPIPDIDKGVITRIDDPTSVDKVIRDACGFSDAQWALIQDLVQYTVPYYKGNKSYPANRTKREKTESELKDYTEYFLRVLRAGFGENKRVSCVAFVEPEGHPQLPVRLLAVYLDSPLDVSYDTEQIHSAELYRRLTALYSGLMKLDASNAGGILFQRIARIYDVTDIAGKMIPTVYIIKPDQVRYWTRSMALRDADDVAADIISWRGSGDASIDMFGARI